MNVDFQVKTLEIAGFSSALKALRLPFGKDARSAVSSSYERDFDINTFKYVSNCSVDEKDINLLSTLIKRGDEHAKVVRGIIVYAEINAPRYWWAEMDTYRIGCERMASESTMHIQGKGLNTDDLLKMKSELNEGTMQKRIQYFSYQTLRRIYFQRKGHRLPHWEIFRKWIEKLPYSNELITIKRDEVQKQ